MGGTDEDEGYSITTDASGNVYVTGTFQETADFDTGEGTVNLTSNGTYDIFFTKYSPDGELIWAKSAGGSSSDCG